jgi:hypothetical protein
MTTTAPRSNSTRTLTRAATALAAALVPVLAGLALLCSERARRKAIALFGGDHIASAPAAQIGKTWGIGLVMIGALQALGSLALGVSITDPAAVLLRTVFALAAEALLLLLTTRTAANPTPGRLTPP